METGETPNKPRNTFSRRGFLAIGLTALGIAAAKAIGIPNIPISSDPKEKSESIIPAPTPQFTKTKPVATPTTSASFETHSPQMKPVETDPKPKISAIEAIVPIPIGAPVRPKAEIEYANHALTIKDIDTGLMFLVDQIARRKLLETRFNIRQNEKQANLTILTQEKIDWAEQNGIIPEVLGICIDAYPKAQRVIAILKKDLRDDLKNNTAALSQITPDDIMINPGGMAALVRTETDSFIDIGSVPAIKQINTASSEFAYDAEALKTLCTKISKDTGLLFDPNNVPGSQRGNTSKNISGGAIGMQFMPSKALEIYNFFDKYNLRRNLETDPELHFNPFDPNMAVIGAWVFLARHEDLGSLGERIGYMRGNDRKMEFALRKWNNVSSIAQKVIQNASDYWDRFIGPQTA